MFYDRVLKRTEKKASSEAGTRVPWVMYWVASYNWMMAGVLGNRRVLRHPRLGGPPGGLAKELECWSQQAEWLEEGGRGC